MTTYPPGMTGADRAVWDLLMRSHTFHTVTSRWSPERQAVVDSCFCGEESWLPSRPAAVVTVTVVEPARLALPSRPIHLTAVTGESA